MGNQSFKILMGYCSNPVGIEISVRSSFIPLEIPKSYGKIVFHIATFFVAFFFSNVNISLDR